MILTVNAATQLEMVNDQHAEPLFQLLETNRDHLRTFLPWVDYMQTVEDFHAFIKGAALRNEAGNELGMTILYNGRVAGRAGIYYIHPQNKTGALGYWIGEEFEGKGIITACCKTLCAHGFQKMGLNRVELKCATGNSRSAAVAERLEFIKEGVLRQAEFVNDTFLDLFLFAQLKSDWELKVAHTSSRN